MIAIPRSTMLVGDCLERMRELADASVDAVVTDPPYGLRFMGRAWDHGVPGEPFWAEALRVAKPGTHLVAFGGSRTYHRLACGIEDAGWEVRDCLSWLYGSGFPKSLDVAKAIDKAAGAERQDVYEDRSGCDTNTAYGKGLGRGLIERRPTTDAAREWDGWGTGLKPAWEPIILARKPLAGTVAANVLEHGTGALHVDACRIGSEPRHNPSCRNNGGSASPVLTAGRETAGRWPANVVLDEDAGAMLDEQAGSGPSRFFYCPKANKRDRDHGLDGMPLRPAGALNMRTDAHAHANGEQTSPRRNTHPTVKPTELMRWLVRLVAPPGGLVLDPFAGSGSTGKAAMLEGFRFIGIEKNAEYARLAAARINAAAMESPG